RIRRRPAKQVPAKSFLLKFDLVTFLLPRQLDSTAPDKFDNPAQFITIEPGSMALANIDDHVRAFGEIDSIHQLPAMRARNVAYLLFVSDPRLLFICKSLAEDVGGPFAIGANQFKDRGVEP